MTLRKRLLIAVPFIGVIAWFGISYLLYMVRPSNNSWSENSAEWVRADVPFGNWIIDTAENVVYSPPKQGGPQLKRLPTVGVGQAAKAHHSYLPPAIKPIFAHPLPGEGRWRATGPPVGGGPPVLVTTFRSELAYPQIVAYVAWFDHTRTATGYYPGRYEPPHAAVRGPSMIPEDQRSRLLAAFNAGFIYPDGKNGSADNGRVNEPFTVGNATLVGYTNGHIALTKWTAKDRITPHVAWARQSLAPILWHRRLNPMLNTDPNSPQWGYTLGGVTRVWRTGVGVDKRGNLIYVVANDQTVETLAAILKHAGAVNGMEFDINPDWHTLITYTHHKGLHPTMVEPQPQRPATRYLTPDDRDFLAVYSRRPGPVSTPFK